MRKRKPALLAACVATLLAFSSMASAQLNPAPAPGLLNGGGIGPSLPIPQVLNPDGTIPDQYIVTLKKPLNLLDNLGFEQQIQLLLKGIGGGEVLSIYDTALYGFAVRIPAAKLNLLKALPQVADVEPDQVLTVSSVQQNNPPSWGLDRIDQASLPLDDKYYSPDWQGEGANIYIMDSGINANHQEFAGRISKDPNQHVWVKSVASDPWDCNGHGTHVAGTAAGSTVGVAKKATLHSIRVIGCDGRLPESGLLAGMDWVAKYARQPAILNMSLGTTGGRSTAIEKAAKAIVNANVMVAVAAGNQGISACNRSPSAEPSVVTVAATRDSDHRWYTSATSASNYGSCVDLFAPGVDIVSAAFNNNSGYLIGTGTSMASPHVAGAMAIWRVRFPSATASVFQNNLIAYHTTPDKVLDPGWYSPNRLLYIDRSPTAAFTSNCQNMTCSFDGSSSTDDRSAKLTYLWDFGDGTTATTATASHTYAKPGIYKVTLTVGDGTTQTGTASRTLLELPLL